MRSELATLFIGPHSNYRRRIMSLCMAARKASDFQCAAITDINGVAKSGLSGIAVQRQFSIRVEAGGAGLRRSLFCG
jgi:hypothetical protein